MAATDKALSILISGGGGGGSGGGSSGGGTNLVQTNYLANSVSLTGAGSGVVDGTAFTSIQSFDLKGGDDSATIGTVGSLAGLLNGGNGSDELNLNIGANAFTITGDGTGTANGTGTGTTNVTSISSFEEVNLLGGDDTATIDLLNPATAVRSLLLNGGDGNDVLDIKLSDQEFAELEDTDALMQLGSYLADPTGKTLDIAFVTSRFLPVDLRVRPLITLFPPMINHQKPQPSPQLLPLLPTRHQPVV